MENLYRGYRVCSKHFENKMFLSDLHNRLQHHAVPVLLLDPITPHDVNTPVPTSSTNSKGDKKLKVFASMYMLYCSHMSSNYDILAMHMDKSFLFNKLILFIGLKDQFPLEITSPDEQCTASSFVTTTSRTICSSSSLHGSTQTPASFTSSSPRKINLRTTIKKDKKKN